MPSQRSIAGSGIAALGLVGVALLMQLGCPQPPAPTGGVTAGEVQDVLNERFNSLNRNFALWRAQPDLTRIMIDYAQRFFMIQKAAEAGDWALAQYQLDEAIKAQRIAEVVSLPSIAALLRNFEQTQLSVLQADIQASDLASFGTHLASAIAACNACHVATGVGYIAVQPATLPPQSWLALAPSAPITPAPPDPSFTSPTPPFSGDQRLTGPELNQLIDFTFNTPDRNLTLWRIQPNLGAVMMEYGLHFAMMSLSINAEDRGGALYRFEQMIETQRIAEIIRPDLAPQLQAFEVGLLNPLRDAINSGNSAAFATAYGNAAVGCNVCHIDTGRPFIRVQAPTTMPEPVLFFTPSLPVPDPQPAPAPNPPVVPEVPTLADATAAIDFRLDNADRNLALWYIQPDLSTLMIENGYHFGVLWFAAQAQNWPHAAYQLQQTTQILQEVEPTRPDAAQVLASFQGSFVAPLLDAVNAQDLAAFNLAYQNTATGCTACHTASSRGYIDVGVPLSTPADYLRP